MENTGPQGQTSTGPASPQTHKPAIAERTQGQRGRRAKVPKPTPAKKPLKLSLDTETHERLAIHALRRGQTISEVVTDLATRHLNDWVLHARPGPRSEAV